MEDVKPVSTPVDLSQVKEKAKTILNVPYQSLMYLSVLTKPDIWYITSYLSQFNTKYTNIHWKMTKKVLRYLKGTQGVCITYKPAKKRRIRRCRLC